MRRMTRSRRTGKLGAGKGVFAAPGRLAAALAIALLAAACGDFDQPSLTRQELLDPETCADCHPDHYREWSGSMHAYSSDDPVFTAMNQRGQRETDGQLGDFCVKCHAPMAVLEGATTDGLDMESVPRELRGVTCYFCHSVDRVEDTHNNPLVLADDLAMRGGIRDPVDNGKHASAYSPLHNRDAAESSGLCGSCHDIVTDAGVHLERTYKEWQESLFGQDGPGHLSCNDCHMTGTPGVVADFDGVPLRRRNEHTFAGVDQALTDWPEKEGQLAAIARDLDPVLQPRICVEMDPTPQVRIRLDNVSSGHMWPSGASQDRRAWVEWIAYDEAGEVMAQGGVVEPGVPVVSLEGVDDNLWLLRDRTLDADGETTHMFWDVAEIESELLPPAVTNDRNDPAFYHAVEKFFSLPNVPTRVTMRVRMEPIGLDVIDDLVESDDLAPAVRDASVETLLTLAGSEKEWTLDGTGLFQCEPNIP